VLIGCFHVGKNVRYREKAQRNEEKEAGDPLISILEDKSHGALLFGFLER
jgi:hypothetical protein